MLMFQVPDVAAAQARADALGVRAVFAIELDDIAEAHLHPSDMRAAIVSLSAPSPRRRGDGAVRTGRPRSAPLRLAGATVAESVARCWRAVLGGEPPGIALETEPAEPGVVEIRLEGEREAVLELDRVRVLARPG